MICKGMSGADVTALQALLVAHGYTVNAVNGVFDRSTDSAVRKYQADHGLAVDGIAGNNTWTSILRR
jgi:peptidoglycan hydrolase-like protein with peptidoglycan-binding domain